MLAASPMASSTAITESLKFLSKVLHLAEKATSSGKPLGDSPHLEVLVRQVSGLALLPPEQLSTWIRRLVVGSPADNEMDAETNTSLLRKLMEVLSKEEWWVVLSSSPDLPASFGTRSEAEGLVSQVT